MCSSALLWDGLRPREEQGPDPALQSSGGARHRSAASISLPARASSRADVEPWADTVQKMFLLPVHGVAGGAIGDLSLAQSDLGKGSQEEKEVIQRN